MATTAIAADSSGNKVAELRYKVQSVGESRYSSGTTPTKRQYTGQLSETAIGLYFFNARWYDSALGRWAQPDSMHCS
jgi:RHS repeat-associated protein